MKKSVDTVGKYYDRILAEIDQPEHEKKPQYKVIMENGRIISVSEVTASVKLIKKDDAD